MTIHSNRVFSDNAPGSWYVNDECIVCGLCENVAPAVFRLSADYSHNMVHHQPATPEELAEAEDARERCPVEAIGTRLPRELPDGEEGAAAPAA